jgi:iron complex transport system substrate-binding protein
VLPPDELSAAAPDVIFVAPCGFEQTRAACDTQQLWAHAWWRDLPAVRAGRVFALDANSYFARPGPRVVQGAAMLAWLLHGVESDATPKGGWLRVQPPEEWASGAASSENEKPVCDDDELAYPRDRAIS